MFFCLCVYLLIAFESGFPGDLFDGLLGGMFGGGSPFGFGGPRGGRRKQRGQDTLYPLKYVQFGSSFWANCKRTLYI